MLFVGLFVTLTRLPNRWITHRRKAQGVEWVRRMPLAVMKELRAFKNELAGVEGYLFPM
jgi:hypothetical protein